MKVGSLFSGIGGLDLGLERAGMQVVWQVENDPYCNKVLAKHWPEVPRYGDIKKIDFTTLPPVDLICGGFPCQPFSTASSGKRLGKADHRYLWPEMLRVIRTKRPTWIIGENVAGFNGIGLAEMVSDLEGINFQVACFEIPACAFGFNHRRNRLWICAYSDSNSKSGLPVNAKTQVLSGNNCIAGGMGETNGVSSRVDRLKCLGNAVVPQVVEWIGRRIMEAAV